MIFKNRDFILISIICILLGVFIVSQYYAGKEYKKVVAPENNAVLAVEVAKQTKNNADLRLQVKKMTSELDTYKNSTESTKNLYNKYLEDIKKYDQINGIAEKEGQGVIIKINGRLRVTQIIDLINAIKNIGSNFIAINGQRVTQNMDFITLGDLNNPEIVVLGNSKLLKSAIERRGGISEQIISKDTVMTVEETEKVSVPAGRVLKLDYSLIVN